MFQLIKDLTDFKNNLISGKICYLYIFMNKIINN